MSRHFIAVDIGGTKVRAALINWHRGGTDIVRRAEQATQRGWETLSEQIRQLADEVRDGTPYPIEGVGVAMPGGVNPYTGEVTLPPVVCPDVPREVGRAIKELLHPIVGGARVRVGNDAACAAIGEWRFAGHACRGVRDLVYVTVSTGIGCGIILDGKPLWGRSGAAAEFGHVRIDYSPAARHCGCGRRGCLEAYASGTGIAATAAVVLPGEQLTAAQVASRAAAGDALCLQIMDEAATTFGRTLAGLLHLLNPRCLVLGGGVVLGSRRFRLLAEKAMQESVLHQCYVRGLTVDIAVKGDDAGLYGAQLLAAHEEELKLPAD